MGGVNLEGLSSLNGLGSICGLFEGLLLII